MTFCLNMHVEFKGSELTWQNRIGIILQSVRFFYVLLTHPGRPFVKSAFKKNKSAYKKLLSYFSAKTYVVGTQKNRLNETIFLSTLNISSRCWISNYLQFYAQKLCLSKPMDMYIITKIKQCIYYM